MVPVSPSSRLRGKPINWVSLLSKPIELELQEAPPMGSALASPAMQMQSVATNSKAMVLLALIIRSCIWLLYGRGSACPESMC